MSINLAINSVFVETQEFVLNEKNVVIATHNVRNSIVRLAK